MRRIYIIIAAITFLLFLPCVIVSGQSLNPLNAHLQAVRIGLVDEFFDRFNGNAVHPDLSAISDDSRKKNLMVLLDLSQFSSRKDSLFKEASAMMERVISDSVQINFSDTTWAAIAHCQGKLDGKNVKFDLYLTIQHRKLDMYKWVIAKVDGDIFGIEPRSDDERIMLNPNDHETNFISLRRASNDQPHNIERFMSKSFAYDATSVFTYLVYNRKLKIDYVDDLEFVFTQIPDYIFHVKYFDRDSSNSGWLISNFYKSSDESKEAFLCSLHSRTNREALVADTIIDVDNLVEDSTKVGIDIDFRDMYFARMCERVAQLNDYIKSLSNKGSIDSQMSGYFKEKLLSLFADSTIVHLRYSDNSARNVNVLSFCEMLKDQDILCESVDSICVPGWNDTINSLSPDVKKINLPSERYSVAKIRREPHNLVEAITSSNQLLFAFKVNTELGPEWIPIFGDVTVRVKLKENRNKSKTIKRQ